MGSGTPTVKLPSTARKASRERVPRFGVGSVPLAASGTTRAKARTKKSSFFIGTSFQTQRVWTRHLSSSDWRDEGAGAALAFPNPMEDLRCELMHSSDATIQEQ